MSTPSLSPPARRARGRRGIGHLYQRGEIWWAQYFVNGRRGEAADFLTARLRHFAD